MSEWNSTVNDPRLPKANLLKVEWHWWWFRDIYHKAQGKTPRHPWKLLFWLYSRMANASMLYVGPLMMVWRRLWLFGPARTYYPQFFNEQ